MLCKTEALFGEYHGLLNQKQSKTNILVDIGLCFLDPDLCFTHLFQLVRKRSQIPEDALPTPLLLTHEGFYIPTFSLEFRVRHMLLDRGIYETTHPSNTSV